MNSRVDIAIVGAGITGSTLAAALADGPFRIALVDRGPAVRFPVEYALRVSALGRAADRVLAGVGVWPEIQSRRVCPYRRMFVWDADSFGHIEFDSSRLASPYLGHIIENDLIVAALHQRLASAANIELLFDTGLESLTVRDEQVELWTQAGARLNARVLVGADGAASWVRTSLDLSQHRVAYHQQGIVCQVRTEQSHRHTAWQRFLATGPVAFLPLAGGDCSIVWSCDEPLAEELLNLDDHQFARRLHSAIEGRLGDIVQVGPRRGFPLQRAHARHYVAERSVLIGDAAHIVHPLAGQGANLGIADAAALAEVLFDAHLADRDIGGSRTLRRYERWRKGENLLTLGLMDGLQKLFAQRNPALRFFRGAGLTATDRIGWLKEELAARAMGTHGDLSRLARGLPLAEPRVAAQP